MGNKPHHSGHYGGGRDLSKGKTPQDADIKVMPIINRAGSYKMGMSMRGPLDKHVKVNSWEEEDVKRGRKQMAEGHKGHAEALFDDAHGSWNWSKSHHSTGAEMRGPLNQEDPKKSKMEKKVRCKPGFKMHNGECVPVGTKVSGWGPTKEVK